MSKGPRSTVIHCADHHLSVGVVDGVMRHVYGPRTDSCDSKDFYVETYQRVELGEATRILSLGPNERDVIRSGCQAMISHNTDWMNAWRMWAHRWLNGEAVGYFDATDIAQAVDGAE